MIDETTAGARPRRVRTARRLWAAAGTPALLAGALTVLVLLARLAPMPALVDGESGTAIGDVALGTPTAYVALAPLSTLLDTLSLLTVRQHIALGVTLVASVLMWRGVVALWHQYRPPADARPLARRAAAHVAALLGALTLAVACYVASALLPRPMAGLDVVDPSAVVVDFHSHTAASHDGRRGFTVEANRAWHTAAGFDAAYVTDHRRPGSTAAPPSVAAVAPGGGTVLLPGAEVVFAGEHVVGLGPDAFAALSAAVAPRPPMRADSAASAPWPVVVHTIPERLLHVAPGGAERRGAAAIELVDGAPRGLGQAARDRERILRIADSLDLAVVAGSNNHGWGSTAAAWSVLHIPGWRTLSPAALDGAIQAQIRARRRHAVRVVRRHPVPGARSRRGLALVGPALVWTTLATQSGAESVVTLAWAWIIAAGVGVARLRRAVRASPARVTPRARPATARAA